MIEPGPSIATIHGLHEHDPWKTEDDPLAQQADDIQRGITRRLMDEGFFDEPAFVDPPDDDDPTIPIESSLPQFWRLTIFNRRMSDVLKVEPSLKKLSLAFKNTSLGCWIAFTGKRIASRFEATLKAQDFSTSLSICDIMGEPTGGGSVNDKAEHFFYCIADYGRDIRVFFVPVTYWNEHADVLRSDLGIADLIKDRMIATDLAYCYHAIQQNMLDAKVFLDRLGFRENLLFQAFINDL
jgi:hypothetical protein